MVTTIELENMQFRAYHGCYDLEQKVGNNFNVSLSIDAEIGSAAQDDNIMGTVSYLDAYELVAKEMAIKSRIIEHVALRIIDKLYDSYPQIKRVTIKVSKIAPPLGGKLDKASVILTR